jgi:hypothetical protein
MLRSPFIMAHQVRPESTDLQGVIGTEQLNGGRFCNISVTIGWQSSGNYDR